MRNKQNLKGFTLIEILVVIALLGVLGLILTNILTQVLRGQNKINTINLVKQNGQVILDKLSSEIRSAENVICLGTTLDPGTRIVFYGKGNYTRIRFQKPTASVNGSFTREYFIKDNSIDVGQLCAETDTTHGQANSLTDTDKNKGVSIIYDGTEPIFEKQSQPGSPDLILIRFRATEGVGAVNSAQENKVTEGGVLFTTAVSVRGGK